MRICHPLVACAALLLAPALAGAQTVTNLSAQIDPTTLNRDDCGKSYRLTIRATANGRPVADLGGSDRWTIRVDDSTSCDGGGVVNRRPAAIVGQEGSYEVTLTGAQIVQAGLGIGCDELASDAVLYVCALWENEDSELGEKKASAKVEVDVTGPPQPTLLSVRSGHRKLYLDWEIASDEDVDHWQVCWRPVPGSIEEALEADGRDDEGYEDEANEEGAYETFGLGGEGGEVGVGGEGGEGGEVGAGGEGGEVGVGGEGGEVGVGGEGGEVGAGGEGGEAGAGGEGGEVGVGGEGGEVGVGGAGGGTGVGDEVCETGSRRRVERGTRYTLEGLRNRVTYQVAVRAFDESDNPSPASNVLEGTPRRTIGLRQALVDAGTAETGGCTGASGPATLAGLISALFLARRLFGRR